MLNEKMSFAGALKMAQNEGYAENDPADDIDGFDALYKLTILTIFGMKKIIHPSLLIPDSFTEVDIKDMKYAEELGYRIKPIALIVNNKGVFKYKIGPCLVPLNNIIANTFDNFNTILIESENYGQLAFYGQGAGAKPTATAMFDDLINTIEMKTPNEIPQYPLVIPEAIVRYHSKLYWRFVVKNEVGVLSSLTSVLADNKINIEKIIQKGELA